MKKTRKKFMIGILTLVFMATATACSNSSEKKNTEPEIKGVSDKTIEAGSEINVMEGITASDTEDGDLTSKIKIESTPSLAFTNGKTVPEKAGSYELTYSVTDKGGLTVEKYATLTVTKQTSEAVIYKDFDFDTQHPVDNKGWNAKVAEGVLAKGEIKQGAYVFDIVSPGNGDGDIALVKAGLPVKEADYKVKVWAKSSAKTYAHIIARNEGTEEWSTFGGAYNVVIGEEITPLELNFSVDKEGSTELMINLGKITPNPDNPSDTTPENFTVTIDKIEIIEAVGEEIQKPIFTNDFSSTDGISVSADDGASATATIENGAAKIDINSYPTEGGVWSIKSEVALPDVTIEAGKKYYYSFKITSQNAQSGECLIESATLYDKNRVHFNGLSLAANEEKVVTGIFTAENAISDPIIRLQIGAPSDGITANSIVIDDVVFGKVEGDLDTTKTIDSFIAFGNGSDNATNPDYPWATYNGTDEDNERGVGTIWTENGSLFYRIDQGGTTDWHNKLICGYNENPLVLKSDSYYTVEITAKATKDISCGFFLNVLGTWEPRLSEKLDITTKEQTFSFTTTDPFVVDMNFEMLFQFGSEETAGLGEVTIEISDIKILQRSIS